MRPRRFSRMLLGCVLALLCDVFIAPNPAAADPEIKPLKRVLIRDAGDKKVGTVLSFGVGVYTENCLNAQTIALELSSQAFGINETYSLLVCADGFVSQEQLHFTTPDCTGQPYFNVSITNSLVPRSVVLRRSGQQTLYVEDPSSTLEELEVFSRATGGAAEPECVLQTGITPLRKAIPLLDLKTEYTPPFRLD